MNRTERDVRRLVKKAAGATIDANDKPERGFILVVRRADGATLPVSTRTNPTDVARWLRRVTT